MLVVKVNVNEIYVLKLLLIRKLAIVQVNNEFNRGFISEIAFSSSIAKLC